MLARSIVQGYVSIMEKNTQLSWHEQEIGKQSIIEK
jgi:hypothetical protein